MRSAIKRVLATCLPMPAYAALNQYVASADIRRRRRWEPELDLVAQFVQSGDLVIDVGANHGLYSFHFSRMAGDAGVVHAFEPIPFNFQILSRTTSKLANVVRHPEAVGEAQRRQSSSCRWRTAFRRQDGLAAPPIGMRKESATSAT